MANSLSEQLLKAGLITQEQIVDAEQAKQQQKVKAKLAREQGRSPNQAARGAKPAPAKPGKGGEGRGNGRPQAKSGQPAPPAVAAEQPRPKPKRPASDLEQFYRERASLERQEKAAEEQRKREMAERKKRTRQQVRELLAANPLNVEDAAIRYNFVIGDSVKYLYVTEQQQQELADGKLAITFMDGKRCLISNEVARQLRVIDPDKLVIINNDPATDVTDTTAIEASNEPDELNLSDSSLPG